MTEHDEKILYHIFARNCEVRRITKAEAAQFLDRCHALGYTPCRYRYGLFVSKVPSVSKSATADSIAARSAYPVGTMVAVGCFASLRNFDGVHSAEWVRYASLPEIRVTGGMSKVLRAFVDDAHPDDIMSYADAATSDGAAYRSLGFVEEAPKVFPDGRKSLKFRLLIKNQNLR